jgi:hypothetical protein
VKRRRGLVGLRLVTVTLAVVVVAAAGRAAAAGCVTASDCPLPGAPCELCADGSTACPVASCVDGVCQYRPATCPDACAAGLTWCSLSGHCVNAACLSCCQFGTSCVSAADCGQACVTCPNGSPVCAAAQCGTSLAGQCFYSEPTCPAAPAVPALPKWIVFLIGGALTLVGGRALRRSRVG